MHSLDILMRAAFGLAGVVAMGTAGATSGTSDAQLRAELTPLLQRRIFFGHQSVGMNVLEGLKQLVDQEGIPLRIVKASTPLVVEAGTISHTFVAENGDPERKFRSFAEALGPTGTAGVDIAVFKLCWIDFQPQTDSQALFAKYQATLADLQAKHPGVTFVHVTTPLTTVQSGPKAFLKRLLGRTPYGLAENTRREEYNALLRNTYRGREPLFDLAAVESTLPDGRQATVEWNGRTIPVLAAPYTDDGSHLNGSGQVRAARELVALLASIPAKR